jgi:shikimate dehydrogenase
MTQSIESSQRVTSSTIPQPRIKMLTFPNGETRVHLILGDPVAQTKSPAGLTAEFAGRGVNAICIPVHVAAPNFNAFVAAVKRAQNIDGIVVTIPHKFAALHHCDEASDRARFLGAANVLCRVAAERWRGDMTDGAAMVAALQQAGCTPAGKRALVAGAGGAGSAVALALVEAGVTALAVVDVDPQRCASLVGRLATRAAGIVESASPDPAGCDIVVNATPAGMSAGDPLPVDATRLEPSAFVADLVTRPAMTPLLKAARGRGCKVLTGEDMFAAHAGTMADFLLAPRRGDMPLSVANTTKSG